MGQNAFKIIQEQNDVGLTQKLILIGALIFLENFFSMTEKKNLYWITVAHRNYTTFKSILQSNLEVNYNFFES